MNKDRITDNEQAASKIQELQQELDHVRAQTRQPNYAFNHFKKLDLSSINKSQHDHMRGSDNLSSLSSVDRQRVADKVKLEISLAKAERDLQVSNQRIKDLESQSDVFTSTKQNRYKGNQPDFDVKLFA